MAAPKSAPGERKRSGKWSIAAPPNWYLDELTVLREVDGELGAALLLALYNVRLVAGSPVEMRGELFGGRVSLEDIDGVPGEIREAMNLFQRLVLSPDTVADRELVRGCRAVAEWAEGRSHAITSIAYAEAAAHLVPEDPALANLAGRACRRAGDRARAELWYERAWGLARRSGNVVEYVNGHLGFGGLLRDFSEYRRALRWIKRAGLSARKKGMKEAGAEALHDAYILAYLREDLARASTLARRAARVYPVHAGRRPYFSADLALLMSRHGLYQEALELLEMVFDRLRAPVERLHIRGLIAYASGGAQEPEIFDAALAEVRDSADRFPEAGGAALAYAAAGAHLLERWDLADSLIELASERTKDDMLASDLAARVTRDIASRSPGVQRPPDDDPYTAVLRGLFPEVASRMRRWRGPTWRPPKK